MAHTILCGIVNAEAHVILASEHGNGKRELWFLNDHAASYVIEIYGKGYEFARSLP